MTLLEFAQRTTEQGRMFVPATVNVSAGLPAAADVCDSEPIVGGASAVAGLERVKGNEFDVPTEFDTATPTVAGNAASDAEMEAVSWVALTNVVVCAAPFQVTCASLVKFVPLTVSVNP